MLRVTLYVFLLVVLNACAPVLLGRTPGPAPVGGTRVSAALGYPVDLTRVSVCEDPQRQSECATEYVGPDYWPKVLPVGLTFARGLTPTSEYNVSVYLSPSFSETLFGVRVGGKELLSADAVLLAGDYGASLYLSNFGIDAGLLGSVPLAGAELYGALRGFGTLNFSGFPSVAASLTLGGAVSVSHESRVLLELTLLANSYNGIGPQEGVQPVGFSLIPAVGFEF